MSTNIYEFGIGEYAGILDNATERVGDALKMLRAGKKARYTLSHIELIAIRSQLQATLNILPKP